MYFVVSYDVADNRRRRQLVELLKDYGRRVQESVFECALEPAELEQLRARLEELLDAEADSCRIYPVCDRCAQRVWVCGRGQPYSVRKVVVI